MNPQAGPQTHEILPNVESLLVELKLSEILQSCPRFSFYQELINLKHLEQSYKTPNAPPQAQPKYDLFQIINTVEDIIHYLDEVRDICLETVEYCKAAGLAENTRYLNWLYDGKDEVAEVLRNIESVDQIVSQLLVLLELRVNNQASVESTEETIPETFYNEILDQFELISEVSLDIRNHLFFNFKKDLPVAVAFHDIYYAGLDSLNSEIQECFKLYFRVHESRFNDRLQFPDLATVVLKLQLAITDKAHTESDAKLASKIKLPTFSAAEEATYQEYLALPERIVPLNAAVHVLPQKIEEFADISKPHYLDLLNAINHKLAKFLDNWNLLNSDLRMLEMTTINERWLELYRYMMRELDREAGQVTINNQTLALTGGVSRDVLCEMQQKVEITQQAFTVFGEIIAAVDDPTIQKMVHSLQKEYHTLLPSWNCAVREFAELVNAQPADESPEASRKHSNTNAAGLRMFRVGSKNAESPMLPNGEFSPDMRSVSDPGTFQSFDMACRVGQTEGEASPTQINIKNKNRRSWMMIQPVLIEDSSPKTMSKFFPEQSVLTPTEARDSKASPIWVNFSSENIHGQGGLNITSPIEMDNSMSNSMSNSRSNSVVKYGRSSNSQDGSFNDDETDTSIEVLAQKLSKIRISPNGLFFRDNAQRAPALNPISEGLFPPFMASAGTYHPVQPLTILLPSLQPLQSSSGSLNQRRSLVRASPNNRISRIPRLSSMIHQPSLVAQSPPLSATSSDEYDFAFSNRVRDDGNHNHLRRQRSSVGPQTGSKLPQRPRSALSFIPVPIASAVKLSSGKTLSPPLPPADYSFKQVSRPSSAEAPNGATTARQVFLYGGLPRPPSSRVSVSLNLRNENETPYGRVKPLAMYR
ncbi:hypothetical protein BABINDRAFT_100419 [Babjeviella inositovora NRRL Y-12698]|uniref:Karyogamy protein n=1 Tax=Babjeviella inositovora NRRL Y-12698 TaxID=984486 RepID=A0A1E3QI14_9ASCO|nr:uncharacterized protein BABINDRAFT_100419 [Babjeviella inositovora NRRL Y-12698]ODQ77336.1 hypothetical protein BABINDRAFT_100419 [Babjeviella inositovora NRRL Y-12698]